MHRALPGGGRSLPAPAAKVRAQGEKGGWGNAEGRSAKTPGSWVDVYGQNLGTGTDGFNHYIASIYWSMTTTTTVGYGDILPVTDAERMFVTVVMLVGIIVLGYVRK